MDHGPWGAKAKGIPWGFIYEEEFIEKNILKFIRKKCVSTNKHGGQHPNGHGRWEKQKARI
jgi:hypothetical protein